MKIAKIAVNCPVFGFFDYLIPPSAEGSLKRGDFVHIPFGKFKKDGVITEIRETASHPYELKPVASSVPISSLSLLQLELGLYIQNEYLNAPGPSFFMMKPSGTRQTVKYRFFITEKGREMLSSRRFTDAKHGILSLLEEGKGLMKAGLKRAVKSDNIDRDINYLVKAGCIRKEEETAKEVKRRKLLYAKLLDGNTERLSEKGVKVVHFLQRYGGFCSYGTLSKKFGLVKKDLKELLKNEKIALEECDLVIDSFIDPGLADGRSLELNEEQKKIKAGISADIKARRHSEHLLFGITGSGKTEVYFECAKDAVAEGRKALILVPEISLTPQVAARFKNRFGERLAVYHSKLTPNERADIYKGAAAGAYDIIIGPRSIMFLPLPDIGLVVIDEFQDTSFIQDQAEPYYNGPDVARFLASAHSAPIIYVSATPSVEMYRRTVLGQVTRHYLSRRAPEASVLPDIAIVNMAEESDHMLSKELHGEIAETLSRGEQVLLFYNRRGFFRSITCPKCGNIVKCPNCDIPFTYHFDSNDLICHYCGVSMPVPSRCPECGAFKLHQKGMGVEQVAERIKELFPGRTVERVDQDITKDMMKLQKILGDFREGKVDVLVGTQVIAKGVDFPNVTLVGVISSEILFAFPEYDISEKAFNILVQVSGRAGRGGKKGKVIIQTYDPAGEVTRFALAQDFEAFYAYEIALREQLSFPPFKKLGRAVIGDRDEEKARANAEKVKKHLDTGAVESFGPIPSLIRKVNNIFYFEVMFKYAEKKDVLPILSAAKKKFGFVRFKV